MPSNRRARLIQACDVSAVRAAGLKLAQQNALVAFPTETVYGLGANALSPTAVQAVFAAKQRPATDPLICHVADAEQALTLWNVTTDERVALEALMKEFWPGPLTLVAHSAKLVPPVVTAGTGFVGVRCPNHDLALELIRSAGVPVVGPSANKFSEISPSCAEHVYKSFRSVDVDILDGGHCAVGIESTVCRVRQQEGKVHAAVLRRGAVTVEEIRRVFESCVPLDKRGEVEVKICFAPVEEALEGPGMYLKHYAPQVRTILVSMNDPPGSCTDVSKIRVCDAVILDALGILQSLKGSAKAYFSMGKTIAEVRRSLFGFLHQAEEVAKGEDSPIFIADFAFVDSSETAMAVYDRIFRAASGQIEKI